MLTLQTGGEGTKQEIKSVERVSLLKTKTSLETGGGVEVAGWFTPGRPPLPRRLNK